MASGMAMNSKGQLIITEMVNSKLKRCSTEEDSL